MRGEDGVYALTWMGKKFVYVLLSFIKPRATLSDGRNLYFFLLNKSFLRIHGGRKFDICV